MKTRLIVAAAAALLASSGAGAKQAESPQSGQDAAEAVRAWIGEHLGDWPERSRRLAAALIAQYGEPNEATERQLVWYDRGPWKRTVLHRRETPRDPAPQSSRPSSL